jgi:hypothetical protein
MSKDTQISNKKILAILHTADESMLNDNGNLVYLTMKVELDLLQ